MCTHLLLLVVVSAQVPADTKAPVPDEAAQSAALATIGEVYAPEYEKAKAPVQKIELAKTLLKVGQATRDDPASRYVLFRVARDLAAEQGDLSLALDAIDQLDDHFDIDKLQMQVDAATAAAKAAKTPTDYRQLPELVATLIEKAVDTDRYDEAKSLAGLALDCARKSRNTDLIKQIVAMSKEVEDVAAEFEKVKDAKVVLEAKPTDPSANLAVGKFLCFVKGDWQTGVPMLALGSVEDLKIAALLELEASPDKALELGDAWWKVADSLQGTGKTRVQSRAGEWYRRALPRLSGLAKVRVEKLLEERKPSEENTAAVVGKKDPWLVIFRSADPSIWNKDVEEKDKFAMSLDKAPADISYLRMAISPRHFVIIPITKERLGKKDLDGERYCWVGDNEFRSNGFHLGILDKRMSAVRGDVIIFFGHELRGSGFGHLHFDDVQGYSWAGVSIQPTVFEIAVTSGELTKQEETFLLK